MKNIFYLILLSILITGNAWAAGDKKHHAGLFLGATTLTHQNNKTYFAFGAEYEYHLSPLFGIGPIVDFTVRSHFTTLGVVGFFVHPAGGLKAYVAPGGVFESGHSAFVLRVGTGYDFHLGNFTVGPVVNADFEQGHVLMVYGLTAGRAF